MLAIIIISSIFGYIFTGALIGLWVADRVLGGDYWDDNGVAFLSTVAWPLALPVILASVVYQRLTRVKIPEARVVPKE